MRVRQLLSAKHRYNSTLPSAFKLIGASRGFCFLCALLIAHGAFQIQCSDVYLKKLVASNYNAPVSSNATSINVTSATATRPPHSRVKRGVIQLASMISCVAGCDPLAYKGYGCYCGYRGSGIPIDAIDRCCLQHDWCYTRSTCSQFLLYVMPYQWQCVSPGFAQCGIPLHHGSHDCSYRLCECDRVLAECLSQFECPAFKPHCRASLSPLPMILG